MSGVKNFLFTVAEYLARENASAVRSEFYQCEIFAMPDASPDHNQIKENVVGEIGGRLKGSKCRTRSSDQRVKVQETGFICYPDVLVVCDEPKYDDSDPYALVNPSVIIEVLSPSNERHDRIFKFRQYQQIPSLKEYVLVHQTHMVIELFTRSADAGWRHQIFMGKSGDFHLESISLAIPMADIFAGVDIPEQVEDVATD
jgi:Uma2 family endonuclease